MSFTILFIPYKICIKLYAYEEVKNLIIKFDSF